MRVLALDVGSSSVRARAYDERGRAQGESARRAYRPAFGADGSAELDAEALVSAATEVLEEARTGDVEAVGISCFWHTLLLLDPSGEPLTPVLLWQDRRSAAQAEELAQRLDAEEVHRRTGCVLHSSYWPAKLAWLAAERPGLLERAGHVVSFADYLFLRLTGELRTSLSTASATGLVELTSRSWDGELLETLGLDERLLPAISDEPAGDVYPPLGDGACSNIGAGCTTPDRAALMVGTSGAYRVVRDAGPADPRRGLFCYLVDERRVVEGGAVSDGGGLYAWVDRTLSVDDFAPGEPDGHGLTFLPLLGGERSPGWSTGARGAVAGLSVTTSAGDVLQAALEGIAYRFAEIADLLPGVSEVVATGHALLADPHWIQVCADVLGRRVVASAVSEGSERGAAVAVLERLGVEPEPASLGEAYEPDPTRTEIYAAARERQRVLYRALV